MASFLVKNDSHRTANISTPTEDTTGRPCVMGNGYVKHGWLHA